jgi:phosphoribosylformylglycinamidine synthase
MGQFVGCVEGIAEACRALDFPVVSGNVSLYNETKNDNGSSLAILPTPAIGGVGLLEDWEKSATIAPKAIGDVIFLIGRTGGHLDQSLWLHEIRGRAEGPPPSVNLQREREHAAFIRRAIEQGLATAVHDISDGGMLVALVEMALASGMGMTISPLDLETTPTGLAFGEDQGRYLVATDAPERLRALVEQVDVEAHIFAVADGKPRLRWHEKALDPAWTEVSLADLRGAHESFFPRLMGSELMPEF